MAIDEAEVEARQAEPDAEPETGAFPCEVCGKGFPSARSRARHMRAHPKGGPARATPSGRRPSRTQQGLTLAYGLAAMAFGAFGPPPVEARQRTALAAQMTARQAGAALDRGLQKTPLYPLVSAVFGLSAMLDDLVPAALPVVVGLYNYAPAEARQRVRPMARMLCGQVLHQAFGDAPPPEPEQVTPVALPAWIVELTGQLLPEPDFSDRVQEGATA